MPATARWIDPQGVPVRIFGHRASQPWRDRIFALGVAWTLIRERNRYQIVYFLMQGLHLAVGLPVARMLSKPIVMKVSGSNIITSLRRSRLGRIELACLRRWAYRTMILNPGMAQEAANAGFPADRLLWMPNPVDVDEFTPCDEAERRRLRSSVGLSPDFPVILYVGRLAQEKELSSLIDAFASVIRQHPAAVLILVGEGPERSALSDQVTRLGLTEMVQFTGQVKLTEVRKWLQLSDIFALVSSLEGFPCSLVEAMATSLPSVVSNIPGNTQLIDPGVHGLISEQGRAESIAEALGTLLDNAELRKSMGQAARQRVEREFSLDRVLDRYEALFAEAMQGSLTVAGQGS
jgi:glycosyltransferase involved in cell wall biosynthesis